MVVRADFRILVFMNRFAAVLVFVLGCTPLLGQSRISFTESLPQNEITISNGGEVAVFNYSQGKQATLFLTHARRDIVERARQSISPDAKIYAPEASRETLENAGQHWQDWWEARYNYYGQQVTKLPTKAFPATDYVADGKSIEWAGTTIQVLETPGYTRDGVSYLVKDDAGKTVAITGDLIWKGGRVFDIYSFQDAIPDAKIGSYHGYGARFAQWIASLEKLAAAKPDRILPARGPAIENPAEDIRKAIQRVRRVYRSFLEMNALHWYFGEERMTAAADRTLEKDHGMKPLIEPLAEHIDLPDWCQHIGTTKLLVSEDGHGFALDVGGKKQFEGIQQALDDGLIKKLEGIWVTHTHNDHTAYVAEAARTFDCPVYAVHEVADVLVHPGRWFLPGTSANAVDAERMKTMADGEKMKWRGFDLTAHFFPGQMYNHGALLVEKPGHDGVYFVGDAFSPSGMDDYCLMNRNLMREDTGYELCFKKIGELPEGSWLVNQHIPHLFKFSTAERAILQATYSERAQLINEMTPWDDVNYAIDEEWAWFYPYGQEAKSGDTVEVTLRVWNHSEKVRTFKVKLHEVEGLKVSESEKAVTLNGRETGEVSFTVEISAGATKEKVHVLTADIESDPGIKVEHWCEALVRVK